MYNLTTTTTNEDQELTMKNLWKRPGGAFAKVTGWAAIAALLYGFYKILPFLVAAAANLLVLILELVALAILVYLITSKDVRRVVKLTWLQVMRKLYGIVVNIDPIHILQNGINEMVKKLDIVRENVTKLEALLVGMKEKNKTYKSEFEKNISKRKTIQKKLTDPTVPSSEMLKYKATLQLINNEITRGEAQIKAQNERIATSEKYLKVMKNLETAADFKVKDAQNELRYRKDEYEQAKAQQKAMSSITSILKGNMSKTMEEELAMEQVTNTINTSIAEMNRLLDGSNDILVNFELDTAANATKADEILARFDANGFDIFNAESTASSYASAKPKAAIPEGDKVYVVKHNSEPEHQSYFTE